MTDEILYAIAIVSFAIAIYCLGKLHGEIKTERFHNEMQQRRLMKRRLNNKQP